MSKVRILIADDHAIVRMGVKLLLSAEKEFQIIGEAEDGMGALEMSLKAEPDLIILDLMMPKMNGVDVTRKVKEKLPGAKIVLLTSFATAEGLAQALQYGANGIVLKSSAEVELIPAIRTVLSGKRHLSVGLKGQLKLSLPTIVLTERQECILRSVMEGRSNADIARHQGIAEITVKNHLAAIFNKLSVSNRSEAVAVAMKKHLLE
jgi:DNA-binding NarL/FixJ family response regulator